MTCRYLRLANSKVALLQLQHIPSNHFNVGLRSSLLSSIDQAMKEDCKAITIIGEGKGFSMGRDVYEIPRRKHTMSPNMTELSNLIESLDIPTLAVMHGYVNNSALELALACHFRIADATAKFSFADVNTLGLITDAGGSLRLPKLIPPKDALDMLVKGNELTAKEALECNLIDKLLVHNLSVMISKVSDDNVKNNFAVEEVLELALSSQVQDGDLDGHRLSRKSLDDVQDKITDAEFLSYYNDNASLLKSKKAPFAAFKMVQVSHKVPDFSMALAMEQRQFDELLKSPQSKALQYLHFAEKKNSKLVGALQKSEQKDMLDTEFQDKVSLVPKLREMFVDMCETLVQEDVSPDQIDTAFRELLNVDVPPSSLLLGTRVSPVSVSDAAAMGNIDIISRVIFPLVNFCCKEIEKSFLLEESKQLTPEEIDVLLMNSKLNFGLPRHTGGLLFYAEKVIGLREVMARLRVGAEEHPEDESKAMSELLTTCVQGQSTIREEIYFRRNGE